MQTDIRFYTQDAAILDILRDLEEKKIRDREFSDVISTKGEQTFQYVDLVQEGGGVLGIALLGYTYVLEKMNIRFLELAGASAGAINTMLMAASGPIENAKTEWILDQIAKKDFFDFVDGDSDARDFIDALLSDSGNLKLVIKGAQVIDNLRDDFGLNSGQNFHNWMKQLLNQCGVKNNADLNKIRIQTPNELRLRDGKFLTAERHKRVAIIAADITTESKIEFPGMANLYWANTDSVNPADFVRASMSIPFFFHPFKIKNIPQGEPAWNEWVEKTGFRGNIPGEVLFMDGGTMSNFPINLFHNYAKVPDAPTFGVKLGIDRTDANKNDKFFSVIGSLFNSSRHVHDYDFLCQNPDYRRLICMIETGTHNWLNFSISDTEKLDLFIKGATAASLFLKSFDWPEYKLLRKKLVGWDA